MRPHRRMAAGLPTVECHRSPLSAEVHEQKRSDQNIRSALNPSCPKPILSQNPAHIRDTVPFLGGVIGSEGSYGDLMR